MIFVLLLACVVAAQRTTTQASVVDEASATNYTVRYASSYTAPYEPFAYSAGYTGYPDGTYSAPAFSYSTYTRFY